MKLAIVGSRGLNISNIGDYIPRGVDEIVSGGAKGIDLCAAEYARANGIKLTEFLPEYSRYRLAAPLKRNEKIADYADEALVFWDGFSKGTKHTVDVFNKLKKPVVVVVIDKSLTKSSE